jgi:hypothetical protein
MSLFTSLFLQSVGVIAGIVIIFQILSKFFVKDSVTDVSDDRGEE